MNNRTYRSRDDQDAPSADEEVEGQSRQTVLSRRSLLRAGVAAGGALGMGDLLSAGQAVPAFARTRSHASNANVKGLYAAVGILTTASYWNGPKAALKRAEKDFGITTSFSGTTGLNDSDLVTILEELIPKKPKGFMIEPADPRAVQNIIRKATKAGIPSMIVNSAYLPGGAQVGYLGFSRQEAAALGAQVIAKKVKGRGGTVIAMVFDASAIAMVDALAGFKQTLNHLRPDLKILEAVDKADIGYGTTLISELLTAHKDIKGIMSLDTVGGQCAANAVKAAKRKGIVIVGGGLDESQTQYWPLIRSGLVQAGILSSSFEQFYVATQYLVNLQSRVIDGINWQKYPSIRVVPNNTDLGSFVIDRSNLSVVSNLKLV